MRIALVSPYSWSYPGGVTRHIDALATHLRAAGHDAEILTPFDPPDRLSARLHRGARPQARALADHVVPLGRTVGFKANGAVSNLAVGPNAVWRLRETIRGGGYDVVHLHEPIAPVICWDVLGFCATPLVGTFHCYSTNRLTNGLGNLAGASRRFNHLHVRIAVSQAAAWTAERFFGGTYRVIPNGVEVPASLERLAPELPTAERPLRLVFVGQTVERKGLPVALRAFEALREHIPVTLDLIGPEPSEIASLLLDPTGVSALGKLADADKLERLRAADMLLAPSLRGESFGMVLTEAFAAGAPVIASDIPGYSDVVNDGADGLLVPPGDATALGTALLELAGDLPRRAAMSDAAAASAHRYAWPVVAEQVLSCYEDAAAMLAPQTRLGRAAVRVGLRPADPDAARQPRRRELPSLEREQRTPRQRALAAARRALIAAVMLAGVGAALFAITRSGRSGSFRACSHRSLRGC